MVRENGGLGLEPCDVGGVAPGNYLIACNVLGAFEVSLKLHSFVRWS